MALSTTRKFLSTPSARRATIVPENCNGFFVISIHALREEGDKLMYSILLPAASFLSTPSARRATCCAGCRILRSCNFYPRPPRGGRLYPPGQSWQHFSLFLSTPSARRATGCFVQLCRNRNISIHALREEGDRADSVIFPEQKVISIHALREEGDPRPALMRWISIYFYPRPPRGGRRDR